MYKLFIICVATLIMCCGSNQSKASEAPITVLCTTFPIYQITRNIVKDKENIDLQLMIPSTMGCPHDYALTPQDMKKLAKAQVLIINGLGMEEFLGAPVKKANSNIQIIDSSTGIKNTLEYMHDIDEEHHHDNDSGHHHHDSDSEHHHDSDSGHNHSENPEHQHGEEGHHHHHEGVNPHIFVSPVMVSEMSMNIAAGLSKIDPEGAGQYYKNASEYVKQMQALNDEFITASKSFTNNRIIEPHGVFDYLARDIGLDIVAVLQAHGQEPSAAKMLNMIKIIESEKPGAIFTEPQYSAKSALTISKETGLPVKELDPVASGPSDAPIDYYQTVMRQNLQTLINTLGVK